MQIEAGRVVKLDYELRDCDGLALEDEGSQLEYLHGGYGAIFPKVEEALAGRRVGHEVKLTLEPEDAFGEYDEAPEDTAKVLFPRHVSAATKWLSGAKPLPKQHQPFVAHVLATVAGIPDEQRETFLTPEAVERLRDGEVM